MDTKTILIIIAALIVGAAGGYYYGDMTGAERGMEEGVVQGRTDLLEEQKKAEEVALEQAREAANPFSGMNEAANPFKDVYTNPFAQ